MYKDVYISGEYLVASFVAFALFCVIDRVSAKKPGKEWLYLRLLSPLFVGIALAPFLPCVDPVPDDSAFLTAVLVGFGSMFAYDVVRRGGRFALIVAGVFLACYAVLAVGAVLQFAYILLLRLG